MRSLSPLLVLCWSSAAYGQGLVLPPSVPTFGSDEFHASDGTSCKSSMDGAKRVEAGAFGTGSSYDSRTVAQPYIFPQEPSQNVGAYVRFSVSLDARKKRMDCSRLYEIELQKKQLELEVLRQSLTAAEEKLRVLEKKQDHTSDGTPPL